MKVISNIWKLHFHRSSISVELTRVVSMIVKCSQPLSEYVSE